MCEYTINIFFDDSYISSIDLLLPFTDICTIHKIKYCNCFNRKLIFDIGSIHNKLGEDIKDICNIALYKFAQFKIKPECIYYNEISSYEEKLINSAYNISILYNYAKNHPNFKFRIKE